MTKEVSEQPEYDFDCSNKTISERFDELTESQTPCLLKWHKEDNPELYQTVKRELIRLIPSKPHRPKSVAQHRYPYVWVIPHLPIEQLSKAQLESFCNDYRLIMYHQRDLYYAILTVRYDQIRELHRIGVNSKAYFPSHKFPSVHSPVTNYGYRSQSLQADMKQAEQHMILPSKLKCNKPGRYMFKTTTATQKDFAYLAQVLIKLFNSPAFAIQNYIYNTFKTPELDDADDEQNEHKQGQPLYVQTKYMSEGLALLLKHRAFQRLQEWRHCLRYSFKTYEKQPFKSAHKTKSIRNNDESKSRLPDCIWNTKFHSMTVVHGHAQPPMGAHWAVVFEGRYYLLTVEYLKRKNDDSGYILLKLAPNTIIGQRVCWYSQSMSYKDWDQQLFTTRWGTLRKSFLPDSDFGGEVSFRYISDLVVHCIKTSDYFLTTNNCQHLARNIFGALDPAEGCILNTILDAGGKASWVPSMPSGLVWTETMMMEKFRGDFMTKMASTRQSLYGDVDDGEDEEHVNRFEEIVAGLGMELFVDEEELMAKRLSMASMVSSLSGISQISGVPVDDMKEEEEEEEEDEDEEEEKEEYEDNEKGVRMFVSALRLVNTEEVMQVFVKQGVNDMQTLKALNDEVLKEFGLNAWGDRYKIVQGIKRLKKC